ncbi:hypothetical protein UFOVP260_39 [uncultured Caudovirales phage]|uniref:Uncharacterized protein n=1 Tax=uncultured Caudovirales phage TaxID=2100421 RepID=A0A6J5LGD6_9CAUD|nr:hypothetical protein UFOVP85_23 [uncultured Caudovirales phage]CAB4132582.1 hypothetical protein UFOVP260_39 [uncultured Caudovirales phage]CAB4202369.1 hypothetical protein UFOVP1363_6 [uncultured Caudovirales phage]CAB5207243.1 hypothetical protein UFOVP179_40 [uncultured Caudovirales phage]
MTFTFNNYATSELSKSPLNDIIENMLGGYEHGVKASYLQPSLAEQLKKAQLENKWYEPNMESQIGLRGAQTGEAGARTGLLGEQTKGARIENQYLPEKMRAQISQLNAQAEQARLMQMVREQLLGGGIGTGQSSGAQGGQSGQQMPMFGGQGMPSPEMPQGAPIQQPTSNMGGMDYSKAATIMQMLGLGKPHVVDANGRYVAITPFGNIDTGVSGLSARDTQLAKEDAKKISDLEKQALSGYQKQETFNELNQDLGSSAFESIRQHPELGRHELAWFEKFGTKDQQEMIGRMRTHMGNIIKDSSRDFAGQFRVGEQALLNSMKPNESDSLSTMKGKAEALTYMNQLLTRRSELEADLMRTQGMSALQARIAANKEIDPKEIKKEIKTILHPAGRMTITPEQARAEIERRRMAKGA